MLQQLLFGVPEIHFKNHKTSSQNESLSTLDIDHSARTMTVTRGIQMKKGSQQMRKAPMRKTSVIEAFASFDIISGSVLRALLFIDKFPLEKISSPVCLSVDSALAVGSFDQGHTNTEGQIRILILIRK